MDPHENPEAADTELFDHETLQSRLEMRQRQVIDMQVMLEDVQAQLDMVKTQNNEKEEVM